MRRVPVVLSLVALGCVAPVPAGALGPGSQDTRFERGEGDFLTAVDAADPPRRGWPAARPVALAAGDAVFAAGVRPLEDESAAVVIQRFAPDGPDDVTWGSAGQVVVRALPTHDEAPEAAIQALAALPDGGVVGVGRETGGRLLAVRLDAAGGVVWRTAPAAGVPWRQTGAVTPDASGGLLVAGAAAGGMGLVRLDLATGGVDPGFGTRVTPVGGCPAMATGVVALADGGVAVGGTTARCGRYTPRGALVIYAPGGERRATWRGSRLGLRHVAGLAPSPGGFVATGPVLDSRARQGPRAHPEERPPFDGVAGLARFDAGGTLVGTVRLGRGNATGVAVDGQGRVLAAADRHFGAVVRRVLPDDTVDPGWDTSEEPQSGLGAPAVLAPAGGGALTAAFGDGALIVTGLRGDAGTGRVAIGTASVGRGGRFRVGLRCTGAPGCEGTVVLRDTRGRLVSRDQDTIFGFRNTGASFYRLRPGRPGVVRLDAIRTPRVVVATVTNPPAAPVTARLRLR